MRVVAVPRCGFIAGEVYIELTSSACAGGPCIVHRLAGHPHNRRSEGCPLDAERPDCATASMPSTCVDDLTHVLPATPAPDSAERIFCTCPCASSPSRPDVELCACPSGLSCGPEGFCVWDALLGP